MSELSELKYDADIGCHVGTHDLDGELVEVCIDASEKTVDVDQLTTVAQSVIDNWPDIHVRLASTVADELHANNYVDETSEVTIANCIPFLLRVYASPDSEISVTIAFDVPSVLDAEVEYIDVEEEINGEWSSVEICPTE